MPYAYLERRACGGCASLSICRQVDPTLIEWQKTLVMMRQRHLCGNSDKTSCKKAAEDAEVDDCRCCCPCRVWHHGPCVKRSEHEGLQPQHCSLHAAHSSNVGISSKAWALLLVYNSQHFASGNAPRMRRAPKYYCHHNCERPFSRLQPAAQAQMASATHLHSTCNFGAPTRMTLSSSPVAMHHARSTPQGMCACYFFLE